MADSPARQPRRNLRQTQSVNYNEDTAAVDEWTVDMIINHINTGSGEVQYVVMWDPTTEPYSDGLHEAVVQYETNLLNIEPHLQTYQSLLTAFEKLRIENQELQRLHVENQEPRRLLVENQELQRLYFENQELQRLQAEGRERRLGLQDRLNDLESKYDALLDTSIALEQHNDNLLEAHLALEKEHHTLEKEHHTLEKLHYALVKEHNALLLEHKGNQKSRPDVQNHVTANVPGLTAVEQPGTSQS